MADRGIIFSAPMVRALLDGRKSQTRRLLKHPEYYGCPTGDCPHEKQSECNEAMQHHALPDAAWSVGDRLYVREAWHAARSLDRTSPRDIPRDADVEHAATARNYAEIGLKGRLRPSIHMPRWASRMWLEVNDVRVQRLQDITEADAIAEGLLFRSWEVESGDDMELCEGWSSDRFLAFRHSVEDTAREGFSVLWNSLHTKPGETWDDNPWIYAVSFNRHLGNIDTVPSQ